jgi:hypothetical protein
MILVAITVLSVSIAVVMTLVAWSFVRADQRRSDARVSALAADIYDGDDDATPVAVNDLFAPDARPRTKGSLANALAIGALVVGSLIALAVVFSRGPATEAAPSVASDGDPAVSPSTDLTRFPLELTALAHDRAGDELTVRGIVRNPEGAGPVVAVFANVFAFNSGGELVATAKAPIDRDSLAGGVESRFLVRIAGVGDVYRYRLSFTVDNRTVAHLDRRDHILTAQVP